MGKLCDILTDAAARDNLKTAWTSTTAAGDFDVLPAGAYVALVETVELHAARTGTPGVKVVFRVCEGEHAGRRLFLDCWLTPAALPATKRDLAKLGVTQPEQLDDLHVPPGRVRCAVNLAVRTDDDGTKRNRVRRFDVIAVDDAPEADPFAPRGEPVEPGGVVPHRVEDLLAALPPAATPEQPDSAGGAT